MSTVIEVFYEIYHPATLRSHQITSRLIVVLVNCWHLMQVRLSRWKSSCSRVDSPQQFGARSVAVGSHPYMGRCNQMKVRRFPSCDQVKACFIFFHGNLAKKKSTVKQSVNPLWLTQSAEWNLFWQVRNLFLHYGRQVALKYIKIIDTVCTLDTVVCKIAIWR